MSLLFNMLSRLVIVFLPGSKHLLISCLQLPSAVILELKKINSVTVSTVYPSICHEVVGWDATIFIFGMVCFKPAFPLSSFTFIKRLFSSSSPSVIRVVSSACLMLLIFLSAILISAWASSNLAFHIMYSAYKVNKQVDNIQPWHTHFPIWNQSVVPCAVIKVISWPAYRLLKRQVRWSGIPNSWRIFQFVVIHIIKGFGIVNKAEIDVFSGTLLLLWWSIGCWLSDLLVPLPFLNSAWTSGSSSFMYCWSLAWRILSITLLVYEMNAIVC